MARGKKQHEPQRPHRPSDLGPRVFRTGRWWRVDLRPWGGGRPTMRDPSARGWPRKGARTEERDLAERWKWNYLEWTRDRKRIRHAGHADPSRPLGELVEAWLAHREHVVAEGTYASNQSILGHLLAHFGRDTPADEVTTAKLQTMFDGLRKRGYKPSTLQTERAVLGAFFGWIGGDNPMQGVRTATPEQKDIHTWDDDELVRLRAAADKLDGIRRGRKPSARLALELALATGARQQELFALRWEDIDAERKEVRIARQLGRHVSDFVPLKSKQARSALVLPSWWEWHDPDATGIILSREDGSPVGHRASWLLGQRILDTASVNAPGRGWHDLRRTYGRLFLEATHGSGMHLLQQYLGHASIRTTERAYGRLAHARALDIGRGMVYEGGHIRLVR